jgi:hypothetical protein
MSHISMVVLVGCVVHVTLYWCRRILLENLNLVDMEIYAPHCSNITLLVELASCMRLVNLCHVA